MGPLKEINFEKYLKKPTNEIPNIWIAMTEITAKARVMLISLFVDRKKGTIADSSPCPSMSPIEPKPGSMPIKFEIRIKRKKVATKGKNLFVFSMSPVTVVIKDSMPSNKASNKFCNLPGTTLRRLLTKRLVPMRNDMAIQDISIVLETGQPLISN